MLTAESSIQKFLICGWTLLDSPVKLGLVAFQMPFHDLRAQSLPPGTLCIILIQLVFVLSGAIQCGYCTPRMIVATKAFLDVNPHPLEVSKH